MSDFARMMSEDKVDKMISLLEKIASKDRPPRLLRLKSAAAYLSISPGTLRGLIQRGEIEVIKPDGNGERGERVPWLVDVRDLDAFIERRKQ